MSALQLSFSVQQISKRSPRTLSVVKLDRILLCTSIALGLTHAWIGRYSMSPDGISYLDVGDSFARRDWAHAVNAYWSPLHSWILGLAINTVKPSPRWEFPVVQLVDFGVFLVALFAFRFLLRSVIAFCRGRAPKRPMESGAASPLPEWALVLAGYAIFLWASLELVTIYDVSPDQAVLACVCIAAAVLLRLRAVPTFGRFAVLGLTLGIGYWIKAPIFPLGFAFLTFAFLWRYQSQTWRRGIAIAVLVFLCTAAPLVILLSEQKGRLTFGDSAKLNYSWFVSPATSFRNWHGEVPGSGTPVHPTREVLRNPPVFEFDGPVAGTYPPWTDPSYWNEGLRWHFKLRPQLRVVSLNLASELRLLTRAQPGLVAGLVVLILLSRRLWLVEMGELWPLVAIPAAALVLYFPVHVEDRFLGGFVLLLFLCLLAAVRLKPSDQASGGYVAIAVFAVMALGTADLTVRDATHHFSIPGVGPNSALEDVVAAERLPNMGIVKGDRIALIGIGNGVYCARLARLRVVAEIMAFDHGYRDFWKIPHANQQQAYDALAKLHVKAILTTCPEDLAGVWQPVPGTSYCTLPLGDAN